jgi:hypothetical protein
LSLDEAGKIKNTEIAKELSLPPVKLHCSSEFGCWGVSYPLLMVSQCLPKTPSVLPSAITGANAQRWRTLKNQVRMFLAFRANKS